MSDPDDEIMSSTTTRRTEIDVPEAITDTLTARPRRYCVILRVRPDQHGTCGARPIWWR